MKQAQSLWKLSTQYIVHDVHPEGVDGIASAKQIYFFKNIEKKLSVMSQGVCSVISLLLFSVQQLKSFFFYLLLATLQALN